MINSYHLYFIIFFVLIPTSLAQTNNQQQAATIPNNFLF